MTNKKIDVWLRFILYFMPILYVAVELWLVGRNGTTQSLNDVYTMINNSLSWTDTNFFNGFTSWIHTNIAISNVCLDFLLYYMYYLVYVELFLLFKNVMLFLFKVADDFLHKGVEL